MFSPNCTEGDSLSQKTLDKAYEIALPDDDPAAMEILFNILQFQNEALPAVIGLTIPTFRDFAPVCDKYNYAKAVSFISSVWLEDLLPHAHGRGELWVVFAAVSFLDNPTAFLLLTKESIVKSVERFLDRRLGVILTSSLLSNCTLH
ncbi:hypothetical protein B0J13DRAFT_640044 [Dactylonectria estremocensis]|uniref:Uncharacterized protein n=1 Tax=Dactylonectria estremocensis TaxID=1079267 RepID=A0A9P9EGM9_9HYPO|nr:hypothetical protein B0J13DRAFT_640044 [Dactylonectria estremocensis]